MVLAWATVAAGAGPVAAALWLTRRGGSLLPPQRWRLVTWNGWHCALACVAFLLIPDLATTNFDPQAVQGWFLAPPADDATATRLVRLVAGLASLPVLVMTWWVIIGRL